jgi:hypothetical protein
MAVTQTESGEPVSYSPLPTLCPEQQSSIWGGRLQAADVRELMKTT